MEITSSDISSGGIVDTSTLSLIFDLSGWIDRGALRTSVSIMVLRAAPPMKCARTARAMAFPLSIYASLRWGHI